MPRTLATRAALAAALLSGVLGARCSKSTDFSITKTFDPVNSAGGGVVYTATQHVDMAAEAGSAWKHKSKVKSLELVGLDATMTANHTGNATLGSGTIVISRNGTDATVGTWTNHPIPANAPDSIGVVLQPGAVSLIMDALKNDGHFDVELTASTVNAINFAADVTLHLTMKFKVP
jgi:hypothetical protein